MTPVSLRSGSDDENEDTEAKAERLSARLRTADAGPASVATDRPRRARGQLRERGEASSEAAVGREEGAVTGAQRLDGATRGREATSGRISLFEASKAVERDGQRRVGSTQAASDADASAVLHDVRQHQASVADRDWLFGSADPQSGGVAEVPAESAVRQAAKDSVSHKGQRKGAAASSVSTEHREFIRAKKFSGGPLTSKPELSVHRCTHSCRKHPASS